MIKQRIQSLSLYLNSLSVRERGLVLLVLLSVIYMVWDGLIQSEFEKEYKTLQNLQLQQKIQHQENDVKLAEETALLVEKKRREEHTKQIIHATQGQLKQTQEQLDRVFDTLVPPHKITELLRSLLLQTNGLKLVSLNNEPAKNITPDSEEKDAKSIANGVILKTSLYEHAATVTLSGNYQQLYQYLITLENSKWGFFWDQLHYKVIEYPIAEITLRVHTISTDENWIGM